MKVCRHCNERKANRPRGLCWTCYHSDAREKYSVSEHLGANRGISLGNRTPGLPETPTDVAPGSDEKVRVLEERAAAGVALWHPGDYRPGRWRGCVSTSRPAKTHCK